MTELQRLLEHPDVTIVDTTAAFGEAQTRRVREGYNRAASGIVEDGDSRLLFMRRNDGWRLPGTDVDAVENFEDRLRTALRNRIGIRAATVEPVRIHRHSATNVEDVPSYHYVLFEVDPEELPAAANGESPADRIELGWFGSPPENVINDGVVSRLFVED